MSASISIERLSFLVVDDNLHMRALIKGILVALGARMVREAADGADALKVLGDFPVDVVIADWSMEPLDGLQFLRILRTAPDSPNRYLPFIMLTGHTEMNRVKEARDAGVTEFLAKPVSVNGLFWRLRAIIEQPRSFVQAPHYFGPDRRRRVLPHRGEDRRSVQPAVTTEPGTSPAPAC